jgi:DNA gyrase inhibitor GyrI
VGPYQLASAEAWRHMSAWLDRQQMRRRAKQGYGFFRDNPKLTAPELLRYDACVPVTAGLDADPEAGIVRQTLPGGAYAVQTHVGSYADAGGLFSRLHREVGADDAFRAGAVVGDDGLPPGLVQVLRHHAREDVVRAAGCERDDEAYGFAGVKLVGALLSGCGGQGRRQHEGDERDHGTHDYLTHGLLRFSIQVDDALLLLREPELFEKRLRSA